MCSDLYAGWAKKETAAAFSSCYEQCCPAAAVFGAIFRVC